MKRVIICLALSSASLLTTGTGCWQGLRCAEMRELAADTSSTGIWIQWVDAKALSHELDPPAQPSFGSIARIGYNSIPMDLDPSAFGMAGAAEARVIRDASRRPIAVFFADAPRRGFVVKLADSSSFGLDSPMIDVVQPRVAVVCRDMRD
jgi:hypothetical protein